MNPTSSSPPPSPTVDPKHILDLSGVQCPMNFVYTKVKLEKMQSGEVLQVILDFKAAFTSVPTSVLRQDLGTIVQQSEQEGVMTLWIRKK